AVGIIMALKIAVAEHPKETIRRLYGCIATIYRIGSQASRRGKKSGEALGENDAAVARVAGRSVDRGAIQELADILPGRPSAESAVLRRSPVSICYQRAHQGAEIAHADSRPRSQLDSLWCAGWKRDHRALRTGG